MSSGQKAILGIIAANVTVFFLWKVPSLQATMLRYFSSAASEFYRNRCDIIMHFGSKRLLYQAVVIKICY